MYFTLFFPSIPSHVAFCVEMSHFPYTWLINGYFCNFNCGFLFPERNVFLRNRGYNNSIRKNTRIYMHIVPFNVNRRNHLSLIFGSFVVQSMKHESTMLYAIPCLSLPFYIDVCVCVSVSECVCV